MAGLSMKVEVQDKVDKVALIAPVAYFKGIDQ